MTVIGRRARQTLFHQYPDTWLDVGFAIVLGAFLAILSLVFARGMSSSLDDFMHALCIWSVTIGFFVSAAALLSNRRWGYMLLAGLVLLAALFYARSWSILAAGWLFWLFLHYRQRYRTAC